MIDVARDFERMQDYIVGRMSDEEQRAFEERLVRDPPWCWKSSVRCGCAKGCSS